MTQKWNGPKMQYDAQWEWRVVGEQGGVTQIWDFQGVGCDIGPKMRRAVIPFCAYVFSSIAVKPIILINLINLIKCLDKIIYLRMIEH